MKKLILLPILLFSTAAFADTFDPSKAPQSWLDAQAEERCESKVKHLMVAMLKSLMAGSDSLA